VFFYSSEKTERKAEADIANQMLEYRQKEENGMTVPQAVKDWKERKFDKLAATSSRRYETYANDFEEHFKNYFLKDITSIDIQHYLESMVESGYATKTIKDQLSVIRLIFKNAVIFHGLKTDPTLYLTPPAGKEAQTREALTEDEVKKVGKSCNCTFGLLAYFLLNTGLRKGEALALQWDDIDFENKRIYVTKSLYFESNNPVVKTPKTEAGKRMVILPDKVADKLMPLRKGGNLPVFSKGDGYMTNSWFTRRWDDYKKESGLNVTPHQLRHTYATILYEANIDEKQAQVLMGHKDISTTKNIYTHLREKKITDAAEKINQIVI
jgi:integrase